MIAIFCSDIHLQHRPPAARSTEDWYAAMKRPLDQLRELQKKHDCPIVCAGDVLDRWNSPPELINWAIENLPKMYAIPGQHDLPYHNMLDIKRSAFWTLVEAGVILPAWPRCCATPKLTLHGFPWGRELESCRPEGLSGFHVAVVHKYVWTKVAGAYPGASVDGHFKSVLRRMTGYDAIVIGDNHVSWQYKKSGMLNPGSLMRRTVGQVSHQPLVGLMDDMGSIDTHFLDVDEDVFAAPEEMPDQSISSEFVEELKTLVSESLDFEAAVRRYAETVDKPVRQVLLEAIGDE